MVLHVPGAEALAARLEREGESVVRASDARVLKVNTGRAVVALASLAAVLKVHGPRGPLRVLLSLFFGSRAAREWNVAHELVRRIVPTAMPLATWEHALSGR